MIKTYCISHQDPLLPQQFFDTIIALGRYQEDSPMHISQLQEFWHTHRYLAYGAAGSYAIPQAIAASGDTSDLIGICSFRKLITRYAIGRPSANHPALQEVPRDQILRLPAEITHPQKGFEFLVANPVKFPQGIIGQYARAHHVIDLLDYVSVALEIGILSSTDAVSFLQETELIVAGCELGVFPRQWIQKTLGQLSELGKAFLSRYQARVATYDAYQIRAVGFLSERLGSFFLMQELKKRYPQGIPPAIFGHLSVVTQDGQHYAIGLGDPG